MKGNQKDTVAKLFIAELPPEHRETVGMQYSWVVGNVSRRVAGKTGLDLAEAQDLAVAAALYALRPAVSGARPWPKTREDWANQATWKAINLARDLAARAKRMPMAFLDESGVSAEGEPLADSPAMIQASVQAWRDRRAAEERRCRCAAVRYAVPKVVHDMGAKNELRTLKIVQAVYFRQLPVPEVCQRFEGLNRNSLYQILFRFRERFGEVGQAYMDEFLDNYSDSARLAA